MKNSQPHTLLEHIQKQLRKINEKKQPNPATLQNGEHSIKDLMAEFNRSFPIDPTLPPSQLYKRLIAVQNRLLTLLSAVQDKMELNARKEKHELILTDINDQNQLIANYFNEDQNEFS